MVVFHVEICSRGVGAEARGPPSHLGMANTPILFKLPSPSYQTILVVLLLALFLWIDNAMPGSLGARVRSAVGSERVLHKIRTAILFIHGAEASFIATTSLRHGASISVAVRTH